jgi:cytochrome c1
VNTADAMAQWLRDPQHFKPGNQMPPSALPDADLQAIALYLQTLK